MSFSLEYTMALVTPPTLFVFGAVAIYVAHKICKSRWRPSHRKPEGSPQSSSPLIVYGAVPTPKKVSFATLVRAPTNTEKPIRANGGVTVTVDADGYEIPIGRPVSVL